MEEDSVILSQQDEMDIESRRQTGSLVLSSKKFVKNGIKYTLATDEGTSNICGHCVIEEVPLTYEKINLQKNNIKYNKKQTL